MALVSDTVLTDESDGRVGIALVGGRSGQDQLDPSEKKRNRRRSAHLLVTKDLRLAYRAGLAVDFDEQPVVISGAERLRRAEQPQIAGAVDAERLRRVFTVCTECLLPRD